MLSLVRYLFVIGTSAIECLGRFFSEMNLLCVKRDLDLILTNKTILVQIQFCVDFDVTRLLQ